MTKPVAPAKAEAQAGQILLVFAGEKAQPEAIGSVGFEGPPAGQSGHVVMYGDS